MSMRNARVLKPAISFPQALRLRDLDNIFSPQRTDFSSLNQRFAKLSLSMPATLKNLSAHCMSVVFMADKVLNRQSHYAYVAFKRMPVLSPASLLLYLLACVWSKRFDDIERAFYQYRHQLSNQLDFVECRAVVACALFILTRTDDCISVIERCRHEDQTDLVRHVIRHASSFGILANIMLLLESLLRLGRIDAFADQATLEFLMTKSQYPSHLLLAQSDVLTMAANYSFVLRWCIKNKDAQRVESYLIGHSAYGIDLDILIGAMHFSITPECRQDIVANLGPSIANYSGQHSNIYAPLTGNIALLESFHQRVIALASKEQHDSLVLSLIQAYSTAGHTGLAVDALRAHTWSQDTTYPQHFHSFSTKKYRSYLITSPFFCIPNISPKIDAYHAIITAYSNNHLLPKALELAREMRADVGVNEYVLIPMLRFFLQSNDVGACYNLLKMAKKTYGVDVSCEMLYLIFTRQLKDLKGSGYSTSHYTRFRKQIETQLGIVDEEVLTCAVVAGYADTAGAEAYRVFQKLIHDNAVLNADARTIILDHLERWGDARLGATMNHEMWQISKPAYFSSLEYRSFCNEIMGEHEGLSENGMTPGDGLLMEMLDLRQNVEKR